MPLPYCLHHHLFYRRRVKSPPTTLTAAKTRFSLHRPPRPWYARKPSAPKSCARAPTAPSHLRHSNSATSRSSWVPHKVGRVFTERFPGSKSWLGKAFFFLGLWWWAVTHALSVVVSHGSQSFQEIFFFTFETLSQRCSPPPFFTFTPLV